MVYEIGSKGLTPCGVNENDGKNSLPTGTVLQLEGYDCPKYIIVKNLGISERFSFYGATYLCVNLNNYTQAQKQAYTLKHISQKKDGRIQTYILDEVLPPGTVLEIWEKSEAKRKNSEARQLAAGEQRTRLIEQGKALFAKHIPAEAKALIIAEHHQDESDSQSDYFNHRTIEGVILDYSLTDRMNFKELRKAALKLPETKHLGPGKGHFSPRVMIAEDFISNGRYYHKGDSSPWHRELYQPNGNSMVFSTKEKAEEYIANKGLPCVISFEDRLISFSWSIEEKDLEHRENYSMGAGYYLKDGHSDKTGWAIKKQRRWRDTWPEEIYFSLGKRCIMEGNPNATA